MNSKTTSIEQGIENTILDIQAKGIPLHSFFVTANSNVIYKNYFHPYKKGMLKRVFSIAKNITALSIFILADEGKINLNDKIHSYFTDKYTGKLHPYIEAVSIRDCLMMKTCHKSTTYKINGGSDWVASFFNVTPTHKSGRVFHYDTSAYHVLGALVYKLTGLDPLEFLKLKIPELNLSKESYMLKDPYGICIGGSGLVCTADDLIPIALLISNKGKINGRQAISSDLISDAIKNHTSTCMPMNIMSESLGYGYSFWINRMGGYNFYGMGGQLIINIPDYDMNIIVTANTQGIAGGNEVIYNSIYSNLLPVIDSKKLYSNLYNFSLIAKNDTFTVNAVSLDKSKKEFLDIINDQIFSSLSESSNFKAFSLSFDEDYHGKLSVTLADKDYSFDFSTDLANTASGILDTESLVYESYGTFLYDGTFLVKIDYIGSYLGSIRFQFAFDGNEVTVFAKTVEETLFKDLNGHFDGIIK